MRPINSLIHKNLIRAQKQTRSHLNYFIAPQTIVKYKELILCSSSLYCARAMLTISSYLFLGLIWCATQLYPIQSVTITIPLRSKAGQRDSFSIRRLRDPNFLRTRPGIPKPQEISVTISRSKVIPIFSRYSQLQDYFFL